MTAIGEGPPIEEASLSKTHLLSSQKDPQPVGTVDISRELGSNAHFLIEAGLMLHADRPYPHHAKNFFLLAPIVENHFGTILLQLKRKFL